MKTLFICSANVGRSQIAEGYYNYFSNSCDASSAALIEDKREKYNFSPSSEVIAIMKEDGIDISNQKIKLLTTKLCIDAERIIVLRPINQIEVSDFTIKGEQPSYILLADYSEKIIVRRL